MPCLYCPAKTEKSQYPSSLSLVGTRIGRYWKTGWGVKNESTDVSLFIGVKQHNKYTTPSPSHILCNCSPGPHNSGFNILPVTPLISPRSAPALTYYHGTLPREEISIWIYTLQLTPDWPLITSFRRCWIMCDIIRHRFQRMHCFETVHSYSWTEKSCLWKLVL